MDIYNYIYIIYLSVCLFVCLSIYLSIYTYINIHGPYWPIVFAHNMY